MRKSRNGLGTVRSARPLQRRFFIAAAAALTLLASVADLMAHDTWLLASAGSVAVGRSVRLDLTSGDAFPADDFAIQASRVVRTIVRSGGTTRPLADPKAAPRSLRFQWTPSKAGIATIGVELAPKTLTLAPDMIEEYLTEINAGPDVRSAWKALGGKRPWVEQYSKHALAYVRVGDPRGDSSWARPLGLALEIVPERDPTTLRAGDTLVLKVLRAGVALPNFAVGMIREGDATARFASTDANGRARVVLKKGGRWLLNGTDLHKSSKPDLVWESDFTTMTLYVQLTSRR